MSKSLRVWTWKADDWRTGGSKFWRSMRIDLFERVQNMIFVSQMNANQTARSVLWMSVHLFPQSFLSLPKVLINKGAIGCRDKGCPYCWSGYLHYWVSDCQHQSKIRYYFSGHLASDWLYWAISIIDREVHCFTRIEPYFRNGFAFPSSLILPKTPISIWTCRIPSVPS